MNLDHVPAGVAANGDDNIVYNIYAPKQHSKSGWGHPFCTKAAKLIAKAFPKAGS